MSEGVSLGGGVLLESLTLVAVGENGGDSDLVWVAEVVEAFFHCGPASPSHCLALRWFRSHVGRLGMGPQFGRTTTPDRWFGNLFLGAIRGGTRVCSSLTSWRIQGPGWFCLWALDLVEVRDVVACVVRLGSHVVAPVFRELLCLGRIFWSLDSTSSTSLSSDPAFF
ncbi:hypothetical protein Taro_041381 [Colocasia esculenta]|uniref:Uncharacterized protein n=1 Tax=Colocasia esculenta TaxID=4460 RepID=A0A843WX54_COLES|nr:hypothetical protein [Colocasia esculenta]